MNTTLKIGDNAPDFLFDTPWSSSLGFYETIQHQNAVFVFLRYHGCPVCQMEMANLKRDIALFNRKNARVFVFLQSDAASVSSLTQEKDWPFDIVCDPKGILFHLYTVEPGGILKYLHPAGLMAAIKSFSRGFGHGKFEGKETQLPATFIINSDKTIKYAHYGSNIGDVPKPSVLAENLDL